MLLRVIMGACWGIQLSDRLSPSGTIQMTRLHSCSPYAETALCAEVISLDSVAIIALLRDLSNPSQVIIYWFLSPGRLDLHMHV
jgi:hypothetical protein